MAVRLDGEAQAVARRLDVTGPDPGSRLGLPVPDDAQAPFGCSVSDRADERIVLVDDGDSVRRQRLDQLLLGLDDPLSWPTR